MIDCAKPMQYLNHETAEQVKDTLLIQIKMFLNNVLEYEQREVISKAKLHLTIYAYYGLKVPIS